jgi:hypothetical protein
MNHIRRILATVAALAGAVLATTAAHASPPPHGGGPAGTPGPIRVIATGGMPGWQIILIAAGAALAGAVMAVLADRGWAARKAHTTTA